MNKLQAMECLKKIDDEIDSVRGRYILERQIEIEKLIEEKMEYLSIVWGKPFRVPLDDHVYRLMPDYDNELTREFRDANNKWADLAHQWCVHGIVRHLQARPGISLTDAERHCLCILNSREPKHEEKICGVGYLMSLWFEYEE